jgi:YD repeat-containing protein
MTYSNRWSLFASATTLIAAGLAAAPVPAQADPPACQQWGFGGTTNIVVNGNTVASFNANGTSFSGPASAGNLTVPTSAVVHENNFIEISQSMPGPEGSGGATQSYNGAVGPDGIAHGTSSNTSPIVQGHPDWATAAPLTCIKQAAPKEGPTVSFDPILGGLNVHITDRSGVTSQCTYDADGFKRSFRLEANGSTDLKIVPAIPKLDNWNINVTCDNGTSTQTTQFF